MRRAGKEMGITNRRGFLTAAAAMAAAGWAGPMGALAQTRRRILIGGARATVVDIHAHCSFPEVRPIIAGTPLESADPGGFATLGPQRIADMNACGIDVAALSVNRFWWYEADEQRAQAIVRLHDEKLTEWCAAHSDRFVALTSPALQFPELAAAQAEYAVRELGHRGVSIGSHARNEIPSSPRFDVLWARIEELGVPVLMHPGNALETVLFVSGMIFDGTLDRFPRLKVVAVYGGGYLPSFLARGQAARHRGSAGCRNLRAPGEYLRDRILVDTAVFSQEGLRHLIAETGVPQLVYGSAGPACGPDTIDLVARAPELTDEQKLAILGRNLKALLSIA